jgi:hypothetical protein
MLKNISAACVNERDFLWLSTVGVVFFQINTWHREWFLYGTKSYVVLQNSV